jgi:hypothetical protein
MKDDYSNVFTISGIAGGTDNNQLELDFDDTVTIKLDDLTNMSTNSSLTWGTNNLGGYSISGIGAQVASGAVLTTSGTGNLSWSNSPYTYDTITLGDYSIGAGNGSLDVKGDANFSGDIKLKGKSLSDVLDNIEKRLAILHPNSELEERWDELKALGERYRELEKEILEKEQMWDILKK